MYQAALWNHARRVIAKVDWHRVELFPRVGFIVTNLGMRAKNVGHFYNQRGTAEQWIKEGKNAVNWTRLSCRDFTDNQVRLQLFALAYNLGNFLRQLALPKPIRHWSMTTLREKLIKIGAKVVSHARYVIRKRVAYPAVLLRYVCNNLGGYAIPHTINSLPNERYRGALLRGRSFSSLPRLRCRESCSQIFSRGYEGSGCLWNNPGSRG